MTETEEMDAIEFINRLSLKRLNNGKPVGGSRTFVGVIIFVRMAFKEYQKAIPVGSILSEALSPQVYM